MNLASDALREDLHDAVSLRVEGAQCTLSLDGSDGDGWGDRPSCRLARGIRRRTSITFMDALQLIFPVLNDPVNPQPWEQDAKGSAVTDSSVRTLTRSALIKASSRKDTRGPLQRIARSHSPQEKRR
jgi:hypothetical protein